MEIVYLTDKELAKHWGVSVHLMRKMRVERNGPPVVKIHRSVRYRLHEAEQWLAERNAKQPEAR